MHSPDKVVVYLVSALLLYWVGMQKGAYKEVLVKNATNLMKTAPTNFVNSNVGPSGVVSRSTMMITSS